MKTTFIQKLQQLGITLTVLTVIGISTSKPVQARGLPVGEMKPCKLSVCSYQTKTEKNSLPKFVAASVLLDASKRSGLPISALKITNTRSTMWSDGCHGIHLPGISCTMALVPAGWLVTVKVGNQRWVYDTDEKGSFVQLLRQRNFPRFKYFPFPISENDPTFIDDPGWGNFPFIKQPYFPRVIDVDSPFIRSDNTNEIGYFDKDESSDSLPNFQNTNDLPEIEAAKTSDVPEPLSVLGVLTFGAFSFGLRQRRKSSPPQNL